MEPFVTGLKVLARFTNAGSQYEFVGRIVGKTKNYYKVESITSPYKEEAPGRMFRIPTPISKKYSADNCIVSVQFEM